MTLSAIATAEITDELRRRGLLVVDPRGGRVLPGLSIETGGCRVRWRGGAVGLSRREGEVLAVLASAWPGAVRGDRLRFAVWGSYAEENIQRAYVCYLRVKLPGLIETLPVGAGYRLALAEEAS
jgi:DNA-binding response OmpR family regulator